MSVLAHANVTAEMEAAPGKLRSGKIVKGNDLGYNHLNNYLFLDDGEYKTVSLGQSPATHKWMRPILDRLMGQSATTWSAALLRKKAQEFFEKESFMTRDALYIPGGDIAVWVTQVLHEILLGKKMSKGEAVYFGLLQNAALLTSTLHAVPSKIMAVTTQVRRLRSHRIKEYMSLIKRDGRGVFPPGLTGEAPGGKLYRLAANILDALMFAGGISVRNLLINGMHILHSQHSPLPVGENDFRPLKSKDVPAFVYEVVRRFPAVVGVPWWDEGYDANRGGSHFTKRTIMNLGQALRDYRVWGMDYMDFRLRPMETYEKLIGVAWAQPTNELTDGGKLGPYSMGCPAQSLSITMITEFFKEWVRVQDSWVLTSTVLPGGITFRDTGIPSFVIGYLGSFAKVAMQGYLAWGSGRKYVFLELGPSLKLRAYARREDRVLDNPDAGCTQTALTGARVVAEKNCFKIHPALWTLQSTLKLCADSDNEASEWLAALQKATPTRAGAAILKHGIGQRLRKFR